MKVSLEGGRALPANDTQPYYRVVPRLVGLQLFTVVV